MKANRDKRAKFIGMASSLRRILSAIGAARLFIFLGEVFLIIASTTCAQSSSNVHSAVRLIQRTRTKKLKKAKGR
jgi:hypothetical protein